MSWSYGFVEKVIEISPKEHYKVLMLCEIYYLKKGKAYAPVNWKDIKKKNSKMIMDDLSEQIKAGKSVFFTEEDFQ